VKGNKILVNMGLNIRTLYFQVFNSYGSYGKQTR